MTRHLAVLIALAVPVRAMAQTPVRLPAPVPIATKGLRPAQAALTFGGFLLITGFFDNGVRLGSQAWRGSVSNGVSRIGYEFGNGRRVLPLLAAGWLTGAALGSARVKDVAAHTLLAGLAAGTAATGVKFLTGRERPSSGLDNGHWDPFRPGDSSFPSGHASIAFGMATALAGEIPGRWDDLGFYGLATITGLSRINDNKHWLSDVVAGAAVGIVAGRWATRGHRRARLAGVPGGVGVQFDF